MGGPGDRERGACPPQPHAAHQRPPQDEDALGTRRSGLRVLAPSRPLPPVRPGGGCPGSDWGPRTESLRRAGSPGGGGVWLPSEAGDRRQGSPQRAFGPHHCPWGPPGGREGSPQSDLSAQRIEAKRTHPLGRRLGHGRRPGFQRAVSGPGPWGATAVLGEGGGGAGAPHLGFQLPLRVQSASTRRWVPNLGPSTPRHSDQGQFEAEGPEASRHAGCPEEVADLSVRRPPLSSPGLELPTESH